MNESSARPALRRRADGVWTSVSWREWWEASERIAAGLIDLGVEPGDRVLLLSDTRIEWVLSDIAILMAGAITVPVYPSLGPRLCAHIARDSGATAAIVADPMQLDKLVEHREQLVGLSACAWVDPEAVAAHKDFRGRIAVRLEEVIGADDPWNCSLEHLAAQGRRALAEDSALVSRRRREVTSTDVATVVYTSGTTGDPRGVMLSHDNLVAQVRALTELELFEPDDLQVLFLPLAHVFARVLYLAAIGYGLETAIVEDPRNLLGDMREVEPTFFAAVQGVFDQVRAKLERDADVDAVRGGLFKVAERIGQSAQRARANLRSDRALDRVGRGLLDRVQPRRGRQIFGPKIRFAISGGAPLSPATEDFFATFGLQILEGYGLTETTAVATVNVLGDHRPGSVGRPLPGVDMTIDEDAEVLVRGRTVSTGYWNDERATAASWDAEGWFHTGDLGSFDRDGFLHITGRKKEMIVTAGGKNVPPLPLEAALESIGVVHQAVVFGDARPFVVAMMSLRPEAVALFATQHGIDADQVATHPEFVAALDTAISDLNLRGWGYAAVRRWAIIEPLSGSAGTLTPTGKLRRGPIAELHAERLEALYRGG